MSLHDARPPPRAAKDRIDTAQVHERTWSAIVDSKPAVRDAREEEAWLVERNGGGIDLKTVFGVRP